MPRKQHFYRTVLNTNQAHSFKEWVSNKYIQRNLDSIGSIKEYIEASIEIKLEKDFE